MTVSEDKLIDNLKKLKQKLRLKGLLSDEDELTIAILIAHLEELKEGAGE